MESFIERINRRYRRVVTTCRVGGPADDLMPSQLTDDMTDEQIRMRLEHKYAHRPGESVDWRAEKEFTGLNRRYAHLHTPKHLTNPDHLDPKLSSGGAPLRIAARYTQGRIPPQQTVSGREEGKKDLVRPASPLALGRRR